MVQPVRHYTRDLTEAVGPARPRAQLVLRRQRTLEPPVKDAPLGIRVAAKLSDVSDSTAGQATE